MNGHTETSKKFKKVKKEKKIILAIIQTWDKQGCLAMVQAYGMGDAINFSSLATTFGVKDGDGNVPKTEAK